jgi:hypothetical protein
MKFLYKIITVLVGVLFLYTIFNLILKTQDLNVLPHLSKLDPLKVVLSCSAYLISHFLRSIRVALMVGRQDYGLLNLIGQQYYTNGINLILPFKLGEFYRILEFNKIIRDSERTFLTIIAERALDFFFLFVGLFVALYFVDYNPVNVKFTIIIGGIFIGGVLVLYYVVPENIRAFNLFIAKRYSTRWTVRFLAVSHKIYTVIVSIKEIFRKKASSILLLTIAIWSFEMMGLLFVTDYIVEWKYIVILAFFVFLSSLIPSGSLGLGGLQLAFYLIYVVQPDFPYLALSMVYQFFIFFPAMILAFIIYIIMKLKKPKPQRV